MPYPGLIKSHHLPANFLDQQHNNHRIQKRKNHQIQIKKKNLNLPEGLEIGLIISATKTILNQEMKTHHIDIQHACAREASITDAMIMLWAKTSLETLTKSAELTIRLVDSEEITELNQRYRQQSKSTNVLAFPADLPKMIKLSRPFLGDVVICAEVLKQESLSQHLALEAHWAHIVIHGILHLLGYDHISDQDAQIMQGFEIKLLQQLGFANPYAEDKTIDQ